MPNKATHLALLMWMEIVNILFKSISICKHLLFFNILVFLLIKLAYGAIGALFILIGTQIAISFDALKAKESYYHGLMKKNRKLRPILRLQCLFTYQKAKPQ